MSRSRKRRNGWGNGWRRTPSEILLPTVGLATPLVVPAADRSLSDGVIVQTVIVARVFGMPLLRLNGTLVLAPGQVLEPVEPVREVREAPTPVERSVPAPADGGAVGAGLAAAAKRVAGTSVRQARLG